MPKIQLKKSENNFTLLIFGASGSLAKLKLFPAIYELAKEKRLPRDFKIVGYARTQMTDKEFKDSFIKSIKSQEKYIDQKALDLVLKNLFYFSGQYNEIEDYKRLKTEIEAIESNANRVRIAYFSVPPLAFKEIFKSLGKINFDTNKSKLRLVIEKPFGYNFSSAKKLKRTLDRNFQDEQIYLLDHYLGKEAVSNLLSLRYANSILTTLMTNKYVSNIQITAMEDKDIEGRANYFDHVGIVRDMLQSHLLQILTYLTMFAPKKRTADSIHHEKARVLKSLKIKDIKNSVVRGQYIGYTKEPGVPKDSQTETFAAMKLTINHPLWKGVPIYLKSGKSMKQKWTAVVIEFRPRWAQREHGDVEPNRLVIQLQPFEKIEFHLLTKLGGQTFSFHDLTTGRPIYCSGDCLSEHGRLFVDVVNGDKSLFLNFEEIFAAWKVVDPLQDLCDKQRKKHCELHKYKQGGLGPKAADQLIEKDGFKWFYSLPKTGEHYDE